MALQAWKKNHPNKEPPPYLVPSSMRKPFTKKMEQYAENIVPIKTKNEQGEPDIVSNKFLFLSFNQCRQEFLFSFQSLKSVI
jgi:hypothetical protein